jgi:hypothetical protein
MIWQSKNSFGTTLTNTRIKLSWADPTNIGRALFEEGLATLVSTTARADATASDYFWFDEGFDGWVAECKKPWTELRQRLLTDMTSTEKDIQKLLRPERTR